ncbi:MAG: NAD(P)/FAD-dependent oxidoreductase [Gammaproteobacteria bacterium]
MVIDFLIVGQGLAGSLLAWELIQRGCRVVVIDNQQNNASQVAAGLINPVTGHRFARSADVDILLPFARAYYAALSDFFQQSFYVEKSMLRVFRSETERRRCLKRLNDPCYRDYLGELISPDNAIEAIAAPLGYVKQRQTGYLQTMNLLSCLKHFFISKERYRRATFHFQDIGFQPRLRWGDLKPEQIIFCEGYRAIENPWFSWLPLQPVKGEILTLEHAFEMPDQIINFGHWLLPVNRSELRLGATFDRENIDAGITESAKRELLNASANVIPGLVKAKLIAHQAGVRPCTSDRQPLIGKHPQYRQINIFNGFGAKGSLSIPWHCRRFADHLLNNGGLPKNCTIERYYATHFAG